jgi:hypothetical protein
VVVWNDASLDWYTTYAVEPSGAMAGAEYSGRSLGSDTDAGALHVLPRLVEYETIAFSMPEPKAPSVQESMISLVASDPLGAPLAMSTLGMAARSVRAPAMPSSMHLRVTGSVWKQGSVIATTSRGWVHVSPPSKDLIMVCAP